GGSTLVVEGNFPADNFSQIAVRVGNNLCGNAALMDPTRIECTVPRGVANTMVPVAVSIDGANTPTPNVLQFTYDAAPQMISLTPDRGPLSGGNLLEIQGANFGNFIDGMPLSIPMVLVGNKLCSNPVFTDETHLLCIVPSSVTATTVNVSVFVDGIASGNKLPYTYAAPAFSNMTPAEGLPAGGYPVVISGSDLGVPGQTSVAVKIGSKYCSSPVLVADSEINCTMPAGTGNNLPVTVYLNGQAKITGLTFSYVTPVPVLQSVTPAQGVAGGGTLITLSGSYFNTIGASVMVGNSACAVQSQTEQEIVCSTTAGNVGMQALIVTVDGNTSNALLFEYTGAMPLNGIFRGSSVQENTGAQ
ncbi:MAG TPA: IPT/TIG domain-containing protein, partial [Pseudomonadales bacterium]|nr:IPT/TIG domain-containing protein [Pseudomonadales bacterium]